MRHRAHGPATSYVLIGRDLRIPGSMDPGARGLAFRASAPKRPIEPEELTVDPILMWVGFNILVLALLSLDLFVFHREAHEVSLKEAAGWSAFWVALS